VRFAGESFGGCSNGITSNQDEKQTSSIDHDAVVDTLGEMYPLLKACEGLDTVFETLLQTMPHDFLQRTADEDTPLHIVLAVAIQDLCRHGELTHQVVAIDHQVMKWARDLRVHMQLENQSGHHSESSRPKGIHPTLVTTRNCERNFPATVPAVSVWHFD
jgi:hypothetical protein